MARASASFTITGTEMTRPDLDPLRRIYIEQLIREALHLVADTLLNLLMGLASR